MASGAAAARPQASRIPFSGQAAGPFAEFGRGSAHDHAHRPRRSRRRSCRARCSSRKISIPTPDRDAMRLLARFENQGPRRVGIDVRGEDASDLLPLLKGRRVIVEPQMMELRFGDEPLRLRFDLELSPDGTQILVKTLLPAPRRPAQVHDDQRGVVRGQPGLVRRRAGGLGAADRSPRLACGRPAAPPRRRSSPSRSTSSPELVMQGLPKVALGGRRGASRVVAGGRRGRSRCRPSASRPAGRSSRLR